MRRARSSRRAATAPSSRCSREAPADADRGGARLAGRALAQPGDDERGVRRGRARRDDDRDRRAARAVRAGDRRAARAADARRERDGPAQARGRRAVRRARAARRARSARSTASRSTASGSSATTPTPPGFVDALALRASRCAATRVVVLGAGGAARAVAYGCARGRRAPSTSSRAHPTPSTWTRARRVDRARRRCFARADLVVDCTPAGLDAAPTPRSPTSLPLDALAPPRVGRDARLSPPRRRCSNARRARGHSTLDGRGDARPSGRARVRDVDAASRRRSR